MSFASSAQNLVPNGSFEEYSICPEEREYNNGQFERCSGWWYPTDYSIGTPDYYNVCNNLGSGIVGIPNNAFGHQAAFDGNAYVGLGAFEYSLYSHEIFAVELIETRLFEALLPCRKYKFSMWVNLADFSTHALSKLGVALTRDSNHLTNLTEWENLEPVWVNSTPIVDTVNWIRLEFDYVANGGEIFLTIGYFEEYDFNELVYNDSTGINTFNSYFPYYYVDSISLIEFGEAENCLPEFPNTFTPNDDQVNDTYSIQGVDVDHFVILNRWGNTIVILDKENPVWDGTINGSQCSSGTYFYETEYNGVNLTGFIELIR